LNASARASRSRILFFVPALLLLAVFVVYPVASTVWISFFTPEGDFAGLSNYASVLAEPDMIDLRGFSRGFPFGAILHNLLWIAIHLPLTVFLGMGLAVILREVKGGAVIKSIVFLGMVTPMVVGGVILRFLFDGNVGVVPAFLSLFGLARRTLTAYPDTALLALILGSLWLWTPFSMVLYSAGLETIPDYVYEAAVIDGASPLAHLLRSDCAPAQAGHRRRGDHVVPVGAQDLRHRIRGNHGRARRRVERAGAADVHVRVQAVQLERCRSRRDAANGGGHGSVDPHVPRSKGW
jgi:ABC-type sugar transport system permease subunit